MKEEDIIRWYDLKSTLCQLEEIQLGPFKNWDKLDNRNKRTLLAFSLKFQVTIE